MERNYTNKAQLLNLPNCEPAQVHLRPSVGFLAMRPESSFHLRFPNGTAGPTWAPSCYLFWSEKPAFFVAPTNGLAHG